MPLPAARTGQEGPAHADNDLLAVGDRRAYPADFLRGLFHSDGCRANNWTQTMIGGKLKRYYYPRWHFTTTAAEIRTWCCEALDLIGVPWRQSDWKTISVSTRAGVAEFDELIGLKA